MLKGLLVCLLQNAQVPSTFSTYCPAPEPTTCMICCVCTRNAPAPRRFMKTFCLPIPITLRRSLTRFTKTGSLRHSLSEALIDFLHSSKAPSVENLSLLHMYPTITPLILIRDGRAAVQSGITSFGWNFEESAKWFARSALKSLNRFDDWTDRQHGIFNALAGDELSALGYKLKTIPCVSASGPTKNPAIPGAPPLHGYSSE